MFWSSRLTASATMPAFVWSVMPTNGSLIDFDWSMRRRMHAGFVRLIWAEYGIAPRSGPRARKSTPIDTRFKGDLPESADGQSRLRLRDSLRREAASGSAEPDAARPSFEMFPAAH